MADTEHNVKHDFVQGLSVNGNSLLDPGDVLPIAMVNANDRFFSFTTSTYTEDLTILTFNIQWDTLPTNATIVFGYYANCGVGTDETVSVKLRNRVDNEDIVSLSTSTDGDAVFSGYSSYTPTTTNEPIRLSTWYKTEPGSNTSSVSDPFAVMGIQL